jgi:hypothetical protein
LAAGNKSGLASHTAKEIASQNGAHGLRFYQDKLQTYDGVNETWGDIPTGGNDIGLSIVDGKICQTYETT